MFVIGHEPSPTCAPTPTALLSMVAVRAKAMSHLRIDVMNIFRGLTWCQVYDYRHEIAELQA